MFSQEKRAGAETLQATADKDTQKEEMSSPLLDGEKGTAELLGSRQVPQEPQDPFK